MSTLSRLAEGGAPDCLPMAEQRAVRQATEAAGGSTRVGCHTFRHSFATHLLEDGYDILPIQERLGDADVSIAMRYPHVATRGGLSVGSPAHRVWPRANRRCDEASLPKRYAANPAPISPCSRRRHSRVTIGRPVG